MRLFHAAFLAGFAATPALAQPANIAVTTAWARATAGSAQSAAVYATVTAAQPDRITGASTPAAAKAELHRSLMEHGVMEMRPVTGGLALTPGTPVHMAPGGYHLMLTGLKQPLKRGDHFPVTLTFEHAAPVTADVAVSGPGASQPDMAGMKMP
jgi:copper(I)-binding protein